MIIRSLKDVETTNHYVNWGNGTSHRLLTTGDNMGFTVCHTIVRAGSESLLEYKHHLEACYCVSGSGEVEDMLGNLYPIQQGTIYALDRNDKHWLRANSQFDLVLVSVFNPPLTGEESHDIDTQEASGY